MDTTRRNGAHRAKRSKREILQKRTDFHNRAARRYRQTYPHGEGSASSLFHPSVPSRWRNGTNTPLGKVLETWLCYWDRGLNESVADEDLVFLRHGKKTIWHSETPVCLKDVFVRAQHADLQEDRSELRAWAEGFNTSALEEHLIDLEKHIALAERKAVAVRQELRKRRMEK